MRTKLGICSICGGEVWMVTAGMPPLPPPTCDSCGATAKPTGPVIPMQKSPPDEPVVINLMDALKQSIAEHEAKSRAVAKGGK